MSSKTNAVASDEHANNDLSDAIEGLGDKTAKALPRLGIGSCAELARYLTEHTAEELSESLAEQGVTIGAKKIENENWLGQARKQAGLANSEPANPKRNAAMAEEGKNTPNPPIKPPDEVPFTVTFKRKKDKWTVTTYDERNPDPEPEWTTEPTEWANWILQQMRPLIGPELAPPEAEAGAPAETRIEILDVQPSEAERFKRLAVPVHFVVSGSKSDRETLAAARTPFWIHLHTADLVSEAVNHVVSQRFELKPKVYEYKKELLFPIPAVGRYELQSLVLFLPPVGRMAFHQGPTINVVP